MFCSRCGTEVQVSSRFCPTCGLDVTTVTQGAGAAVQAAAPPQPDEADIIRDALKDEYELEKELGRGGMAVVFKARDKQLEREVAIKVLPFSLSFDAEFVERFQREARTAGKLEHPNIIPIYRVGKSGRVIYFVMKFIRGKSLSSVIETRGALPVPEIKRVLIEAVRALGYAHKHGIVHRDIKPDNIMFDELGQAVVTDFGIAKAQSGAKLTGTGMSIGTPHYMSPEQARAQNLDGRSDIYSLGVVAYQCLTGHVPFDGEDSFSIGYKHIMEELPTPTLESADQRDLFAVVQKMMAKKAEDRYQSAEELIQALEGTGAVASAISLAEMSTMPTRAIEPLKAPAAAMAATTPLPRASVSMGPPGAAAAAARPGAKPAAGKKLKAPLVAAASLAVVGLGLGVYYIGFVRPGSTGVVGDTTLAGPPVLALGDTGRPGSATPSTPGGTSARPSSTAPGTPPQTATPAVSATPTPTPTPPAPSAPAQPAGEGTLSLAGSIPANARITVDGNSVRSTRLKLPAGRHRLQIVAEGFRPHQATVAIVANQTYVHNVALAAGESEPAQPAAPSGVNCEATSAVANPNRACYDTRPNPRGILQIAMPEACAGSATAATVLVRVSAAGEVVGTPIATSPGSCRAFGAAAAAYAEQLTFAPATKNGQAVTVWVTIPIRPTPRP